MSGAGRVSGACRVKGAGRGAAAFVAAAAWCVALAAIGGAGVGGCASSRSGVEARGGEGAGGAGVGAVAGAAGGAGAVEGSLGVAWHEVFPPGPRERVYEKRAGRSVVREARLISGVGEDGTWTVDRRAFEPGDEAGQGPGLITLRRAAGGGVEVLSVAARRGGRTRVVRYDPPLLLLPERLEPGAGVSTSVELEERDADRTEKPGQRGAASRTVRLVAAAGAFPTADLRLMSDAAAIEVMERIELGPAVVTRSQWLLVQPGRGIVRERLEERTRVLGVQVREKAEEYTLLQSGGGE